MSLTNSQYDSIMHEYDVRQRNRALLIEERKKEIYEVIPEYREIDNLIASTSVKAGLASLAGTGDLSSLKDTIEDLHVKKNLLLTERGYSVNYLDPPYVCPYCKDTGYIGTDLCHCFRQAILDCRYEQTNTRTLIEEENFDSISYEYHTGKELTDFKHAEAKARNLVANIDKGCNNLMLFGSVGTGKSFLSNCIANELLKSGHSVIYLSSISLFENISNYRFKKQGKNYSDNFISDIYSCDLLVIDDLGSELTNQFVCSELFAIINERHIRKKSTVITTNHNLEELANIYSSRVFSRIYSYYDVCEMSGNDIRVYIKRFENRK